MDKIWILIINIWSSLMENDDDQPRQGQDFALTPAVHSCDMFRLIAAVLHDDCDSTTSATARYATVQLDSRDQTGRKSDPTPWLTMSRSHARWNPAIKKGRFPFW